MAFNVHPGLQSLQPYVPGKSADDLARELGLDDIVKLASNENPLGCSPEALRGIRSVLHDLHLYPDGNAQALKQAIQQKFQIALNCITVGNGSNEILELMVAAFVQPDDEVVISEHAFAVYALATQAAGGRLTIAPANASTHQQPYGHDLEAMLSKINDQTRLVFVANPNNPTGTWLSETELRYFVQQVPAHVLVVIDQAYTEYVQAKDYASAIHWPEQYPNVVVTQTFSKIYGLASLRVGYGIASAEVTDYLNRVRQPFNVNTIAQAAAVAALTDDEFVSQSVLANQVGLRQLQTACEALDLSYLPSAGNFLCINVGQADAIYQQLLEQGVIVRPVANYGLPNYLRVTVGTEAENQRFIKALKTCL